MRYLRWQLLVLALLTLVSCKQQPAPQPIGTTIPIAGPTAAPTTIQIAPPTPSPSPIVLPTLTVTPSPMPTVCPGQYDWQPQFSKVMNGFVDLYIIAPPCSRPVYEPDSSYDPQRTYWDVYTNFVPTTPGVYQLWYQVDQGPPASLGTQTVYDYDLGVDWGARAVILQACPPTSLVTTWLEWTPTGGSLQLSSSYAANCPRSEP